ncbi:MAG: hypothetical protein ACRDYZ_07830 [Acidimicrobiales bacterium]
MSQAEAEAAVGSEAGTGGPTGPTSGYGLRPRAQPAPDVLAMVAAAVDQVWPRPVVVEQPETASHLTWRFSGRWWSRPVPARRERPFR